MSARAENSAVWPSLRGARVLVTGAGGGIGQAIAALFGAHGATVGLHYHSRKADAEDMAARIAADGGRAVLLHGDLADADVPDRLMAEFVAGAGGIDVLVNNAGSAAGYRHFREMDVSDWDCVMAVNARAPFWLSRAAWPYMVEQGGGRIVNISSAAVGYGGSVNNVHYTASKAALEAVTVALAKDGVGRNILVNAIRCGLINSGMHRNVSGYTEERYQERSRQVPAGRAGTPAEVAAMVAHLASAEGGFISGQVIAVAGGD